MKKENLLKGFVSSLGVFVYVAVVSLLLFNGGSFFGKEDSFLMPMLMLLMFVVSATITGLLVLGKPLALFLSGQKKDALELLFLTIGWLIFFLLLIIIALIIIR